MGSFPFPPFPAFRSFTWLLSIPLTLPHKVNHPEINYCRVLTSAVSCCILDP